MDYEMLYRGVGKPQPLAGGAEAVLEAILVERVMNLGENRIEMRIPRSPWFPCDLRSPHS